MTLKEKTLAKFRKNEIEDKDCVNFEGVFLDDTVDFEGILDNETAELE